MLIDEAVTTRRTGLSISASNSTADAGLVDRGVALDRVHRLADADFGGEMDHAVDTLQRARDDVLVADVADDQLGVVGQVLGPLAVAVNLLDQAVEDADLVAARKQALE